jgi:hypothetical protein
VAKNASCGKNVGWLWKPGSWAVSGSLWAGQRQRIWLAGFHGFCHHPCGFVQGLWIRMITGQRSLN